VEEEEDDDVEEEEDEEEEKGEGELAFGEFLIFSWGVDGRFCNTTFCPVVVNFCGVDCFLDILLILPLIYLRKISVNFSLWLNNK
jgi:hypothetical protein